MENHERGKIFILVRFIIIQQANTFRLSKVLSRELFLFFYFFNQFSILFRLLGVALLLHQRTVPMVTGKVNSKSVSFGISSDN